ncbi:hypothetical protein [Candidatus Mycoplasma mahonii]|uniref:hypothetical protein n=1 Tax=Candidatus Mycoplasma mahonii TaxID=3004105 RepID=UPI0026F1539F|nr:hypothetical protein [Candidatus Mycoplasma mahonii]WKX02632.1 hypothetical protein O3I44_00955 [Candidatus Mycoplasma mahonii]
MGRTIQDQVKRISINDTVILIAMNGASHLGDKILQDLKKCKNIRKIIVLTASHEIHPHEKIEYFSLSRIDKINYQVDTFERYIFVAARMISFIICLLNDIYKIHKKNK